MPEDDEIFEIWQDIHGEKHICLGSIPEQAIITTSFLVRYITPTADT